jgi:hypothetical protein
MMPPNFKQTLVSKGLLGSLVFIATHTDVLMRSEVAENLNLRPDASALECALARSDYFRNKVFSRVRQAKPVCIHAAVCIHAQALPHARTQTYFVPLTHTLHFSCNRTFTGGSPSGLTTRRQLILHEAKPCSRRSGCTNYKSGNGSTAVTCGRSCRRRCPQ